MVFNRLKSMVFEDDKSSKSKKKKKTEVETPVGDTSPQATSIVSSNNMGQTTSGPDANLKDQIHQNLKLFESQSPAFHAFYRFYDSLGAISEERTRYISALQAAEVSKDHVTYDSLMTSFDFYTMQIDSDQTNTLSALKSEENQIEGLKREVDAVEESIKQAEDQIKTLQESIEDKQKNKQSIIGAIDQKKTDLNDKIGSINITFEEVKNDMNLRQKKCTQYLQPQTAVA